jgi:hypothetical protein
MSYDRRDLRGGGTHHVWHRHPDLGRNRADWVFSVLTKEQNKMRYKFDLVCPRCGKTSDAVADKRALVVSCGDCLMDDTEVVEMKIVRVTVIDDEVE